MSARRDTGTTGNGIAGLSYRTIAGLVLVVLVVVFVALNRDETRISFIVFDSTTSLWVALALAAAVGFGAGFLIGRRRYRG
jgi:uncharacterized integral membrane protein